MSLKYMLSLGKEKKVCGYNIQKLPIGKYLEAIKKLEDLPEQFLAECFPGMTLEEALHELSNINGENIGELLGALIQSAPKWIIDIVAELSDIPSQELLNNPDVGLKGLLEIINALIEVNELGEFWKGIKEMLANRIPIGYKS